MDLNDKIQICSVVCQAILIDAQLTDSEREYLEQLMDRYELSADDRKSVMRRNMDDDVVAMANKIVSTKGKELVLKEVAAVVKIDGDLASVENRLMKKVAQGVGFSENEVKKLFKS
jgi:uncharacterized tellurite resistance protein B-like protein